MIEVFLFIGGIVAGTFATTLGIGGGLVLVPMFTLIFKFPQHTSQGMSLLCAVFASGSGAIIYLHRKVANLKIALIFEAFGIAGGFSGASLAIYIPGKVLMAIFGLGVIIISAFIFRSQEKKNYQGLLQKKNYLLGIPGIFVAGFISGLLGIGGGILKVPVLIFLLDLPLKTAIATSNVMVTFTSLSGEIVYLKESAVPLLKVLPVILGIFIGSYLGTKIHKVVKPLFLKRFFILILIFAGIQMIFRSLI